VGNGLWKTVAESVETDNPVPQPNAAYRSPIYRENFYPGV